MLIQNAAVFTDGMFQNTSISFGERISEIGPDPAGGGETLDAQGCYVIPGLIDIHTHGAVGADASDGDPEGLVKLSKYYAYDGVTSWCPTTMTLAEDRIAKAVRAIRDFIKPQDGAKAVGINMEGPFVSPNRLGAQNPKAAILPDASLVVRMQQESGGMVRIITVAPELEGAEAFIREVSKDMTVSVGHTACDYEQGKNAFQAGASHVTHLYNCIPDMAHRQPGPIPAAVEALATAELITDGIHVHPVMIRTAFQLFGERIVLISDSLRCAGMPDGDYVLAGLAMTMKEGRAFLTGTSTLAGSSIHLTEGMRRCVQYGIPLEKAVTAATYAPAKVLGMEKEIGSLKPGMAADLVLLDRQLQVKQVYIDGRRVR